MIKIEGTYKPLHSKNILVVKVESDPYVVLKALIADTPDVLRDFGLTFGPPEKHHRPWGYYEILAEGPGYLVKRITVDPGKRTSLQWHELRDEVWRVVGGNEWRFDCANDLNRFEVSKSLINILQHRVPYRILHRINNTGTEPLVIIEVQTFDADNPSGEDDIHRLEDDYNRV